MDGKAYLNTEFKRNVSFPIVLTLYAGLPQARYVPDEARIMFDSAVNRSLARISAFLAVDTDAFVMQGERTTAPDLQKK